MCVRVCVCVQGLDSFAAMPNSFRIPDGKMSSPVCSWRVSDSAQLLGLYEGRDRKERLEERRGRESPPLSQPPTPSLLLTTEHCSSSATVSTFPQSEWIPEGSEVTCGLLWTIEREEEVVGFEDFL